MNSLLLLPVRLWLPLFFLSASFFHVHPFANGFVLHHGHSFHHSLYHHQLTATTTTINHPPYIIERLCVTNNNKKVVFDEIAKMCIDVFFNDNSSTAPWKVIQLAYLKALQSADLQCRYERMNHDDDGGGGCMMVARQVILSCQQGQGQRQRKTPLILDVSNVYPKITTDDREQDWIRGEIIGFCEVMERGRRPPILTNLSVRADARDCRIGSKLVEACEDAVVVDFGDKEIFLEVESDNVKALQFYHRRGYQVVLEDPAARRFNTNGIWLTKESCTKISMKKDLTKTMTRKEEGSSTKNSYYDIHKMLQSLRESVFS